MSDEARMNHRLSLPGLTRQSTDKKHFDVCGWMRGSSPHMTTANRVEMDA